jgi:DNA invertase Pin-like site-specific DNA recombinase
MNKPINTGTGIRAGIYIRVSTEEQHLNGLSLPAQRLALEEYAANNGYTVVGIYADEGISARKSMSYRKDLLRLLEDVKQNKMDMILVTKLDRWFRNIKDYNITEEILRMHRCYWKTIFENYDSSTANGQMVINIMLSVNQAECDRTSERIKAVFDYKRSQGMCVTGMCAPYGYIIENGYIKKDPSVSHIVDDAISYYFTCFSIRNTVNYIADKYGDKAPSYYKVDKFFHNPKYAGIDAKGNPYCDPYMSMEQYNIILKSRQAKTCSPSGYTYIFSSLITCPICGCKFSGRQRKRINKDGSVYCDIRYNCVGKFKYHPGASFRESSIEKYLFDHINSAIESALIEYDLSLTKEPRPVKTVQSSVEELNRLNTMYQKGRISEKYYEDEYKRLSEIISSMNIGVITEKREKLSSVLKKFNGDWIDLYEKLDNSHRRAFWKQIIEEIIIDPNDRKISGIKLLM